MEYYQDQNLKTLSETDWRQVALPQLRRKQKPLAKIWAVADAILDIDPDILLMTEIGGRESLENLNRHFLGERFVPHFVEGNSKRGIDLGFLVRRGLPFRAESRSNKDIPIEVHTLRGKGLSMHLATHQAKFSRDVAELRLYAGPALSLILLLTHLKSKISTDQDFHGKDVRTAEAIALADLYKSIRASHPGVPIVVGGDFNNDLSSLDLELVKRTDLTDFHDELGTPLGERFSLVHIEFSGEPKRQTLDYLLVSPELKNQIVKSKSFTYRYKGFYGVPHEPPGNFRERNQMPSDHYPVVLTFRLNGLGD